MALRIVHGLVVVLLKREGRQVERRPGQGVCMVANDREPTITKASQTK